MISSKIFGCKILLYGSVGIKLFRTFIKQQIVFYVTFNLEMNLTLNFGGECIIPRLASFSFGNSSPSTASILNFCSILVNIRKSSCLAKLSPKQTRFPEIYRKQEFNNTLFNAVL